MDSKALTKIQSVALITVVVIAAVSGGVTYLLWKASLPPPEAIRIGICGDLDSPSGRNIYRGALLAVEQINAEGGILGRNLTLVSQDDDSATGGDPVLIVNALTKLITVDKADFIISTGIQTLVQQDVCAEHKKILITIGTAADEYTQRVLDDYDKYKYYFRVWAPNASSMDVGQIQGLAALKNLTGFTKIGYLLPEGDAMREQTIPHLESGLPELGFDLVYRGIFTGQTVDFSSYFSAAEESGAEILFTILASIQRTPSFVKEWYDRQSPMVIWGDLYGAGDPDFWNITEGKTEYISSRSTPVSAGYYLTTKTMATRDAFLERWGEVRTYAVASYDAVRFILSDAIKRAGTIETMAMIRALESTNVETSMAGRFAFTSSHDILIGEAGMATIGEAHMLFSVWQWQGAELVPVFPDKLRIDAGVTYRYPSWNGPWNR